MLTPPLDAHGRPAQLTRCQRAVLRLLRDGLRPAEVAARLHDAESTVRMHIRMSNARLGTHSYHSSLLIAEQMGLLNG